MGHKIYDVRMGVLIFSLACALALFRANAVSAAQPDYSELDAIVAAQMQKHGLPGVSLAIIEGDEVVYLRGYGTSGRNRPMTPQTPMFIGSQSKSFTALAIAQLVERGKLQLDAPVQAYIPWFQVADAGASEKITVRHLLQHTSGLSDAGYSVILPTGTSIEEAVRSLAQARLSAPPGTTHQYFNLGYSTLAYIVEVTSGQSYTDYIQEHILLPLGMSNTTADPQSAQGIAQGYSRLFGFNFSMAQPVPEYDIASGYIVSTAEDMARYAIAMKNGGAGLVSPEMMRQIFTPGPGGYGFGWWIYDNGAKIVHGGANETFATDVNLYPRANRAFVLLINQGHQFDHFVSAAQLRDTLEAVTLGRKPPPVSDGWSVRWPGWGLGLLTMGLGFMHLRNLFGLRSWRERAREMSVGKRIWDVGLSFLIPTVILVLVLSQVKAFYGYRFNLWPTLAHLRFVMPDVFILMLVSILPDYIQGICKLFLLNKSKNNHS
ncbi:MAG: serine hydrolase domain-containing protein [Anaerolineales bacterium]